jgi:UDP-glucose 4-epimerase
MLTRQDNHLQPLKPKRILLTGARGFLGRTLYAQAQGAFPEAEIVAAGKRPPQHPFDPPGPVCDLTKKRSWLSLGDSFEVIYHLAGTLPKKGRSVLSNITMADCLYEACKHWNPSFLAYASTISVYPLGEVDCLTEDVEPRPNSPYGLAKLAGEHYCNLAKNYCGKIAVLRLSSIYGPGKRRDFRTVLDIFIENVLSGRPPTVFGSGKRTQDFVYLTDAARAFIAATKAKSSGVFNIGSGVSTSMYELAEIIIDELGTSSMLPQIHPEAQEDPPVRLDITRAKEILHYYPEVSLREGIKRLLESMLSG